MSINIATNNPFGFPGDFRLYSISMTRLQIVIADANEYITKT